MHEASLVSNLLAQVIRIAEQHEGALIRRIDVHVGPLSGVEPELFQSAFERLKLGTPAESSTLHMTQVELTAHCARCGCDFTSAELRFDCPTCGSREVAILAGDTVMLESVTIDPPLTASTTP